MKRWHFNIGSILSHNMPQTVPALPTYNFGDIVGCSVALAYQRIVKSTLGADFAIDASVLHRMACTRCVAHHYAFFPLRTGPSL